MFCLPFFLVWGLGCRKAAPPLSIEACNKAAEASFQHGDLKTAGHIADDALGRAVTSDPDRLWPLRLLKAQIFLSQGLNPEALAVLTTSAKAAPAKANLAALRGALQASAESNLQQFDLADRTFRTTENMPGALAPEVQEELLIAEGRLAAFRHHPAQAEALFKRGLKVAQDHGHAFPATRALGSLGILQMQQGNYADAADLFFSSLAEAQELDAQAIVVKMSINLGWAYRTMGDLERADELFRKAQEKAKALGMVSDETLALTNIAVIQTKQHNFKDAELEYLQALQLARRLNDSSETADNLIDLAQIAIDEGNFDLAEKYNQEAFLLERSLGDRATELYSIFNQAQIAFGRKDLGTAGQLSSQVVLGTQSDLDLQASALRELAKVHAELGQMEQARGYYQSAIAALEKARASLGRDELKLSFPTNSKDFYDDYIDFLVAQKQSDEAFRVAELQRARTLTEGLGSGSPAAQTFSLGKAQEAAAKSGHVVLSYWIGAKSSYLWALFPQGERFVVLPGEDQIRPLVERYRAHLLGAFFGDNVADPDGQQLYRSLVGPVQDLIGPQANVTIISDGPLYQLNFETLVVSLPTPHYWIEDVSVTNASSAVLLGLGNRAAARSNAGPRKMLLLIGDPHQPQNYPALSHAGEEMRLVQGHFAANQETILAGEHATPRAYFQARPEDYALIHFVAHGTASRVSPLDSSVVLSQDGASYNLYTRDIANTRLHASLVTISACDSAGSRVYSSEGLVGLSWGFLRAGAQQVIASMWEVNDASTPKFMDRFYSALGSGEDPASALRAAKLDLVRSRSVNARPYYWASFVLYEGIGPQYTQKTLKFSHIPVR